MAAAALVAACHHGGSSSSNGPGGELGWLNGREPSAAGIARGNIPLGKPIAFYASAVCTANGKPAQIESVSLKDPENVELVDWGIKPGVGGSGIWPGTVLSDEAFNQGPVTQNCKGKNRAVSEVAVSLKRTGSGTGIMHGFYMRSAGETLFAPVRLALCPKECPDMTMDDLP
ncbi:hypothetical protein [Nocardioides sp.]|uniref:hypothetical protein n=1 Tax=Nocardioides sp. TaxID=35761 RepID=UPI00378523E9